MDPETNEYYRSYNETLKEESFIASGRIELSIYNGEINSFRVAIPESINFRPLKNANIKEFFRDGNEYVFILKDALKNNFILEYAISSGEKFQGNKNLPEIISASRANENHLITIYFRV